MRHVLPCLVRELQGDAPAAQGAKSLRDALRTSEDVKEDLPTKTMLTSSVDLLFYSGLPKFSSGGRPPDRPCCQVRFVALVIGGAGTGRDCVK